MQASSGEIIVYPDSVLRKPGWLMALCVLLLTVFCGRHSALLWWLVPLACMSIALLLAAERCIVFDKATAAVYSRFGPFSRLLITFDAIDSIGPVTSGIAGTCFAIARRSNRYGNRIRVSAYYAFQSSDKAFFENHVLPLLGDMIQASFFTLNMKL